MPINVHTVANHLNSEGWVLISDSYKNLHTELEMKCPNGHVQMRTYDDWRKHPVCDRCFGGNGKKIKKNTVPIKKIDTQRVLSLDAATNLTGYAVFDNGELVSYGTYKTTEETTEAKINEFKRWLQSAIRTWQPDFVGIENIQLQSYNGNQAQVVTFKTLAQLQGVILDTLFEACIDHDLAFSTEWRKYCNINTEKGRENKKKIAQEKVKLWYDQDCTQDEADAICIGKYFTSKLKGSRIKWGEDIE